MTTGLTRTPTPITGSMLYDLVACPHRVTMDLFANPAERDVVSPFIQLLWERGAAHEGEIISSIGEQRIDLSKYSGANNVQRTLEAMDRGESLIYRGRIAIGDLLGEPDLLRKEGNGLRRRRHKVGCRRRGW